MNSARCPYGSFAFEFPRELERIGKRRRAFVLGIAEQHAEVGDRGGEAEFRRRRSI
jgi:hypothetical protein